MSPQNVIPSFQLVEINKAIVVGWMDVGVNSIQRNIYTAFKSQRDSQTPLNCVLSFYRTCFGEGMGDQSSDELVLRGPEQEDDVGRQGVPVLGQEARRVVDHLGVSWWKRKRKMGGGEKKRATHK